MHIFWEDFPRLWPYYVLLNAISYCFHFIYIIVIEFTIYFNAFTG